MVTFLLERTKWKKVQGTSLKNALISSIKHDYRSASDKSPDKTGDALSLPVFHCHPEPIKQFTVTSSTVVKFFIYNFTFEDKAISKRRWHQNIIRANPERGLWLDCGWTVLEIEWSCGCEMRGWLSWESAGLLREQEVTGLTWAGPILRVFK